MRPRLLQEAQRKPIDKELAEKQRAVLSQDLLALKQHSQRFSNASGAVEVVIPGLHANAATVQAGITAHFATLHELLHRREDKMHALVEALTSEKLDAPVGRSMNSWMGSLFPACEPPLMTLNEGTGSTISPSCELPERWAKCL